jgi:hypothetical protein
MRNSGGVANGTTATCMIPPDDVPATPAAAEQMFRASGEFHGIQIKRNNNGTVRGVEIDADGAAVYYFSSQAACQDFMRMEEQQGNVAPDGELN